MLKTEEVVFATRKLQAGKAAPQHLAPAAVWKGLAPILAPKLVAWYNAASAQGQYPSLWAAAWVVWLAKPNKAPVKPANLRPIALQDCGGKSIAKALQVRASPCISEMMSSLPQYAYLPGRLLKVAIVRAVHHCRIIRTRLAGSCPNIQQRRRGMSPSECYGGAILSLDMSQAFDRVDRHKLLMALTHSNMPHSLVQAIAQWHNGVEYHLQVSRQETQVKCGRGLRQGCTMSPTLWVAVLGLILERIGEATDSHWMRQMMTFFADDILEKWEFREMGDLDWFLRCIGCAFQILEEFGMTVNASKSSLLIQLRGHAGRRWLKARTRAVDGRPHLVAKTPQGLIKTIPMVSQITYLGVILSFGNFERATIKHRIKCAENQRRRLQKVLQGKRILSRHHRLRIWQTCVVSTALHGISATGLDPHSLRLLRACFARHVRAIAASPVHLTRENTAQLFHRLGISEPQEQVRQRLERLTHTHG